METTKLLGLKVAGPKDRARISEVTGNFVSLDEFAENWNGFSNSGTVQAEGTDFTITPTLKIATELFSLTVKMPRAYAEGDTITVAGIAYNLYQGTDPALNDAWKAGEVVTINFDKTSRRCWASAGGGAPRPLPAQVSNMAASVPEGETPSIVFTWTNPVDENFSGMVLIVKEGSAPNGVTDGVQVYKGTGTTATYSDGVQWDHTYFGRGFAYNSQNKYQMDATGAIASATPSNIPDQVSGVELTGNKGSATLTWTNPTNLSYSVTKVIQKIDSDPESPTDGTEVYSGTGTETTVSGLQDSINYHFGIFALSEDGKYKPPVTKTYTPQIWPKYDYTGQHTLIKDNVELGRWRIKFLSSGVLTWLSEDTQIDVFLVGGGGSGGENGGGGGYTKTQKGYQIKKNQEIQVQIGAGASTGFSPNGGSTLFDTLSVNGASGIDGGSGGGARDVQQISYSTANGGSGGSDGGNGGNGKTCEGSSTSQTCTYINGGKGQGTTTREFGDAGADLYSGGGGGCAIIRKNATAVGGAGGSGTPVLAQRGTSTSDSSWNRQSGYPGGGYGGGAAGAQASQLPAAQGIAIIRDART